MKPDFLNVLLGLFLAIAILAVMLALLYGCSPDTDTPTRPRSHSLRSETPGVYSAALVGTWSNAPHLPRVEIRIEPGAYWYAAVYPFPGFVCQGVQHAVVNPMYFDGLVPDDTTAHFLAFWSGGVNHLWNAFGYFEADYRQTWAARDTVIGPLIEGRWIMSVYGECMTARESRFWLHRE